MFELKNVSVNSDRDRSVRNSMHSPFSLVFMTLLAAFSLSALFFSCSMPIGGPVAVGDPVVVSDEQSDQVTAWFAEYNKFADLPSADQTAANYNLYVSGIESAVDAAYTSMLTSYPSAVPAAVQPRYANTALLQGLMQSAKATLAHSNQTDNTFNSISESTHKTSAITVFESLVTKDFMVTPAGNGLSANNELTLWKADTTAYMMLGFLKMSVANIDQAVSIVNQKDWDHSQNPKLQRLAGKVHAAKALIDSLSLNQSVSDELTSIYSAMKTMTISTKATILGRLDAVATILTNNNFKTSTDQYRVAAYENYEFAMSLYNYKIADPTNALYESSTERTTSITNSRNAITESRTVSVTPAAFNSSDMAAEYYVLHNVSVPMLSALLAVLEGNLTLANTEAATAGTAASDAAMPKAKADHVKAYEDALSLGYLIDMLIVYDELGKGTQTGIDNAYTKAIALRTRINAETKTDNYIIKAKSYSWAAVGVAIYNYIDSYDGTANNGDYTDAKNAFAQFLAADGYALAHAADQEFVLSIPTAYMLEAYRYTKVNTLDFTEARKQHDLAVVAASGFNGSGDSSKQKVWDDLVYQDVRLSVDEAFALLDAGNVSSAKTKIDSILTQVSGWDTSAIVARQEAYTDTEFAAGIIYYKSGLSSAAITYFDNYAGQSSATTMGKSDAYSLQVYAYTSLSQFANAKTTFETKVWPLVSGWSSDPDIKKAQAYIKGASQGVMAYYGVNDTTHASDFYDTFMNSPAYNAQTNYGADTSLNGVDTKSLKYTVVKESVATLYFYALNYFKIDSNESGHVPTVTEIQSHSYRRSSGLTGQYSQEYVLQVLAQNCGYWANEDVADLQNMLDSLYNKGSMTMVSGTTYFAGFATVPTVKGSFTTAKYDADYAASTPK